MKLHLLLASACALVAGSTASAQITVLASANFSSPSYADGALVGQNGWQRYAVQTTAPLTVSSGSVSWAGGSTVNNEDAFLPFANQIPQPTSGTTVVLLDTILRVNAAPASNPSYFLGLNTLTTSTTSNNFQNARIAAQSSGAGFVLGVRVNGQGGYPFAFGTTELSFGTTYAVRARITMVPGNANDFIDLFVGSSFTSLNLHSTATYSSGPVNDPLFGAIILSQFGNATVNEAGVSFDFVEATLIPEPSAFGLLAGAAGLVLAASRRRRA